MSIIVGTLMMVFGGVGTYLIGLYIENDWRYSYRSPLSNHELTLIIFLLICILAAVAGLFVIIITVWKKRNEDALAKLTNTTSKNLLKNVCPNCGLNVTDGTEICPKCSKPIKK